MKVEQQPLYKLSSEFRLVVACSWVPVNSDRQIALLESLSAEPLNWDEVVSLVIRHGLTGIFSLVMNRLGWVKVPEATKNRLKGLRLQQAAKALGQVAELSRVGRAFAEAGVDLVPLKGVTLSQELYGDPSIRNAGDLDMLVRVKDVAKAGELLEGLGYRHALGFHGLGIRQQQHFVKSLHHHEYIHDSKGIHLELHWRNFLWTEEQVAPLWAASSPANVFGAQVRHLSRGDNILFLADHGTRHSWQNIKWLSDVAMLLENLSVEEWQALYDRAARFDLQRVLLLTTLLLEWFYEIVPPDEIRMLRASDKKVARLATVCTSLLLDSQVDTSHFKGLRLAIVTKILKPRTSLSILLRTVVIQPLDFLTLPLPNCLFWLYIPLRPYFWFRRHFTASST